MLDGKTVLLGVTGSIAAYNEGKIKRCSNYINITEKKDACWMTGGIIGYNKGTIEECINYGTIIGKDGMGGIAGVNNGKISKSVNKGSVTSEQYSARRNSWHKWIQYKLVFFVLLGNWKNL